MMQGKGMMNPMMQQQNMMGKGMMGMPGKGMPGQMPQNPANAPLSAASLASANPGMQKQMIGEKLFAAVSKYQPELAGKITGMMLEMDNSELVALLESEAQIKAKVVEAMS